MEEMNEEKENLLNDNQANETAQHADTDSVTEETPTPPNEPLIPNENENENKDNSHKTLWIIIAAVVAAIVIILVILGCTGKFSKHSGFKKDRNTGLYYRFYGDIHDTADMPKTGDLVGILFTLRAGDSVLIPMTPNEMLMDSLYESDLYAAIRMMHVGDSASFVFDGPDFFENFFQMQEYPFGKDPVYADILLYGLMPHDEFMKAQAEYEAQARMMQQDEDSLIQDYVAQHKELQKTEEGIYMVTTKKGTGVQAEPMQNLRVHYTGRLLDGTVFDSSVERDEPFVFTLGAHQVISGWEIALSKMSVGEKATVLLPSGFAYGERGNYAIPPFSPLVFDIELLGIEETPTSEL